MHELRVGGADKAEGDLGRLDVSTGHPRLHPTVYHPPRWQQPFNNFVSFDTPWNPTNTSFSS